MAIWGSLTTSAIAMDTHTHHLNQIGTNIANMNTTAYKEVETHYQTVASGQDSLATYLSVKPTDTRAVDVQGLINATGKANDLAIAGQGFFLTNAEPDGSGESFYTRDGGFTAKAFDTGVDADGDGINDQSSYLVSQGGHYLMGWASDGNGGWSEDLSAVNYSFTSTSPGKATTSATITGNVPNNNGNRSVTQTSIPAVSSSTDAAGNTTWTSRTLPLVWTPTDGVKNAWDVSIPNSSTIASATVSPSNIPFRYDGTIDPNSGVKELSVTVNWADGSDPTTMTIDISDVTQYSSATNSSEFRLDSVEQDGYMSGTLQTTAWDAQGVLTGTFTNGTTVDLYKLPIATFAAPNELTAISGNEFSASPDSGDADINVLENASSVATIEPGSLELSNVNLEDQFTRMITTQKAYSMAATSFRTSDEMLQTLGTLK